MSVLIGIKDQGKVIIASDSQITLGGVKKIALGNNNHKVWHPNNKDNLLIGSVGLIREKNVIQATPNLVDKLSYFEEKIDYEFVINVLVPKIQDRLKDAKCIQEKDNMLIMNSSYLFAYKDNLFEIHKEGAVVEVTDYTAMGSGANEAMASMYSTKGNSDTINRIKLALMAASNNDIFVSFPLVIGSTDTIKMSVIQNQKE